MLRRATIQHEKLIKANRSSVRADSKSRALEAKKKEKVKYKDWADKMERNHPTSGMRGQKYKRKCGVYGCGNSATSGSDYCSSH